MSDHSDDVGYGKPPKHSQFRKGQSGNPKGRPNKTVAMQTLVRQMLESKVPVTADGHKKNVSVAEALVMQLRNDILTGKPNERARAIKTLREICPDFNIPNVDEDETTEIRIEFVESDNYGSGFDPTENEKKLLKCLWRHHRNGNMSLNDSVSLIERKIDEKFPD